MASEAQPPREGPEPEQAAPAYEHFGPLVLQRVVKDDGRALILFAIDLDDDEDQQ
jgi:hypothetical protein